MATRKSVRIVTKEREARDKDDDRVPDRRASIGDKLGLTPDRTAGRNLVHQKAVSSAKAAAARLDDYNVTKRKKRKSSKKRRAERRKQTEEKESDVQAYKPQTRESMALMGKTVELFNADEEEGKESEGAEVPMPPLVNVGEGEDEEGPNVNK